MIWRAYLAEENKATLREIREEWSYEDLTKFSAILDMREEVDLAIEGSLKEE